jgi:tetratricopeptide (TPR) repeat protein
LFYTLAVPEKTAGTLLNIGNIYYAQCNWDFALQTFLRSYEIFQAINNTAGQALALYNLGLTYLQQGDKKNALEVLSKSRTLYSNAEIEAQRLHDIEELIQCINLDLEIPNKISCEVQ